MIVLASTSYDIAYQALPGFGVLDGASVAPLAAYAGRERVVVLDVAALALTASTRRIAAF